MYIRLVDEHNFKSPILYIHSDEDEFMAEIEKWKKDLLEFVKNNPKVDGLPLGGFDASTCMVDLMRHLTQYYVESTEFSFVEKNIRVLGTLRLLNEDYLTGHVVVEIKTYE